MVLKISVSILGVTKSWTSSFFITAPALKSRNFLISLESRHRSLPTWATNASNASLLILAFFFLNSFTAHFFIILYRSSGFILGSVIFSASFGVTKIGNGSLFFSNIFLINSSFFGSRESGFVAAAATLSHTSSHGSHFAYSETHV